MKDTTRVSLALFAAWAVHDAEELVTMSRNSRRVLARLPRWMPIPDDLRARGLSQAHVDLSLALMAASIAAASMLGVRSGGRSVLFRGALLAFGAHGFTHLAGSVVTRGYTTGVLTAPTVVIPYWLWAWRVLRRNGIRDDDGPASAAAVANLALLFGIHAVARLILGSRSLGPEPAAHDE
ncbi:MAG: HXXEE domain-containing protein [Micropruina sp.]